MNAPDRNAFDVENRQVDDIDGYAQEVLAHGKALLKRQGGFAAHASIVCGGNVGKIAHVDVQIIFDKLGKPGGYRFLSTVAGELHARAVVMAMDTYVKTEQCPPEYADRPIREVREGMVREPGSLAHDHDHDYEAVCITLIVPREPMRHFAAPYYRRTGQKRGKPLDDIVFIDADVALEGVSAFPPWWDDPAENQVLHSPAEVRHGNGNCESDVRNHGIAHNAESSAGGDAERDAHREA